MKSKVITLALIGFFLYACSDDSIINEQDIIVVEELEIIYEQEGWIETINEHDDFYKYKKLLIKTLNAINQQNNIDKKNKITEEKPETIYEQR
ncbi:MAG: hypothetical protein JKY02_06410 [Flavobacteriaceae bacterium]|nr:hypothetical protein [Flavobacteriaceae bacterium]